MSSSKTNALSPGRVWPGKICPLIVWHFVTVYQMRHLAAKQGADLPQRLCKDSAVSTLVGGEGPGGTPTAASQLSPGVCVQSCPVSMCARATSPQHSGFQPGFWGVSTCGLVVVTVITCR